MNAITLIHWNAEEAEGRAELLREAGYEVSIFQSDKGTIGLKPLRDNPPDAFVIDLGRLPSHGRDIALWIRERKATRPIPIVFMGGAPEKVEKIQRVLPDATYSSWEDFASDLQYALDHPPAEPVVPSSATAGYSGTPLPKKLGIKPQATVALLGAPDDFEQTLGTLPEGVRLKRQARGEADVILLFVKAEAELARRFPAAERTLTEKGGLWIAWPKKASGVKTDVTSNEVRSFGLSHEFVDYKVCAIDKTWSGLLFARRKSKG